MNQALWILGAMCLAQLGIIYALVNRLIVQSGQRKMNPQDALDLDSGKPNAAPIVRERIPTGVVRVTG